MLQLGSPVTAAIPFNRPHRTGRERTYLAEAIGLRSLARRRAVHPQGQRAALGAVDGAPCC
jgi:hypothetical protein